MRSPRLRAHRLWFWFFWLIVRYRVAVWLNRVWPSEEAEILMASAASQWYVTLDAYQRGQIGRLSDVVMIG